MAGHAQNGEIIIEADEKINELLNKQTKLNKSKDGVSGYRIQLKNTISQKDNAHELALTALF